MTAFDALTNAILPIFAVPLLGWWLGRRGAFNQADAEAINRFVVLIALPALLVSLLADADLTAIPPATLATFIAVELAIYASGFLLARYAFGAVWREALLLGLAATFVNHVFFVLPIALVVQGSQAEAPIAAIIAADSLILFAGTVLILDLASSKGSGRSQSFKKLLKNPLLVAIGLGIGLNISGASVHRGMQVFIDFAGAAAAPASLFALGLILSAVPLARGALVPGGIAALKLIGHPLLLMGVLGGIEQGDTGAQAMLLVAAGPCGAMPFVIALRYQVRAERIAQAILYSTIASLLSLTLIA